MTLFYIFAWIFWSNPVFIYLYLLRIIFCNAFFVLLRPKYKSSEVRFEDHIFKYEGGRNG